MRTLIVCFLLLLAGAARAACVIQPLATVPLTNTGGTITLPVEVNGQAATFILDTGAQRSVVTGAAVQRLGLARDEWVSTTLGGVGGLERRPNALPRTLSLGGVPLARQTLNHDTSLTVGILPRTRVGAITIDGLLGRDYLSVFDLDLDMPGRQVTLNRVRDCSGRFLPWSGSYKPVPVSMPAETAMMLPVTLDGTPLRAVLDTGASSSLVGAPGMFRLGLSESRLRGDPADSVTGLGPRAVTMYRHAFSTLAVGSVAMSNPTIWVAPIRLPLVADMLLGADWLASHRLWLSYATRQIFVADP